MEIAILVFFLAIFGGVLFLLALIWFIFRRIRNSRSASRNFSGSAVDATAAHGALDADHNAHSGSSVDAGSSSSDGGGSSSSSD